ncbi:type IV pilus modification PilV family protein [Thermodesulforhabdus norvegica]|uniref:Prepilin-type N-terminal cleavage/methylation domain-containing protein n=1 Tax=Thermodesulforhabdus norvegica TaxID=39841 RepID=A0A1I4TZT0_9BACT|nr:type II secretion system protein [Thermodesulforhabdus norvegica]SFM82272.1 prepilin-type N-terminal cleavage/methylation domain-containing protein [Thermodesulforhabdus norvegica]
MKGHCKNTGYSIIELLMAMLVFAIIALATTAMFARYGTGSRYAGELTNGVFALSNLFERYVSAASFADLPNVCDEVPSEVEHFGKRYRVRCEYIEHSPKLGQIYISLAWDQYRHSVGASIYKFRDE